MRSSSSRSGLFLIEMVLVILFFSICAAVCMRVFAAARQTADRSRDLSAAVLAAESAAECWKASKGDLKACAALLHAGQNGDTLVRSFDGDWKETDAPVMFRLTLAAAGGRADISVTDAGGETIFALTSRVSEGGAS